MFLRKKCDRFTSWRNEDGERNAIKSNNGDIRKRIVDSLRMDYDHKTSDALTAFPAYECVCLPDYG
jgi:hypothetical protein